MLDDVMKKLDELYDKTGMRWELTVHRVLTEPVWPTVAINPEGMNCGRYRVACASVPHGLAEAIKRAYGEVMLGEVIEPLPPIAGGDDVKLEGLLVAWRKTD